MGELTNGMAGWRRYNAGHRKLPNGVRPFHLDPTTHALVVIEAEHHEIHEGHMWHLTDTDTDVDISTPKYRLIVAPEESPDVSSLTGPDGKAMQNHDFDYYFCHFYAEVNSDTDCTIEFFEAPTISANGTQLTAYWRNRNRDDTQILTTFYKDPTVSADGTKLAHDKLTTNTRPQRSVGGSSVDRFEWVLYPEKKYIIKVTVESDDAIVTLSSMSYEHPHKDWWWEQAVN